MPPTLRPTCRAVPKGRRTRESGPEPVATASPPVPVKRKRAAVRLPKSSGPSNVASPRQSAKSAESEDVTVMLNVTVTLSERREFKVHSVGEDTSLPDLLHEAVVGVLRRRRPRPSRLARG